MSGDFDNGLRADPDGRVTQGHARVAAARAQAHPVKRITAADARLGGSHLVGHIDATVDDLTAVLGPPDNIAGLGDAKTELEWYVELADGTHANVYNYHDGGRRPIPDPETVVCWHVGSHDDTAADRLAAALEAAPMLPPAQGWMAWSAEHLGGQTAIGEPFPPPSPRDVVADFLERYTDQPYRAADILAGKLDSAGYRIAPVGDPDDPIPPSDTKDIHA